MAEVWDEGLSPQRTELAWRRTGLALVAAVAVLARRAWDLGGGLEVSALVVVAVGGLVWLAGMCLSRDLHVHMEPHGLTGARAFGLVATGTLLLAVGGSIFGVVAPH
jgi:uncharacterized membrane protein YidH (DUF202 family)